MTALAVVVKGWPRLSETFVAQELLGLERRGLAFEIWSLRAPHDGGREHAMHREVRAARRYLPEYLHEAPLRVLRGWRAARRQPGYAAARAAWRADLRADPTRNRIRRWGQALVLAAELPPATRFLYAHFLHTPASVARYAALIRGIGWAVSAHAKDIWTTPEAEIRGKLGAAEFALACTRAGAAHLARLAPEPGRVALVHHGLDLARFPEPPPRTGPGRPFLLLSVGRLVPKKGYDDLLAALARLPAELDWRLVQIGGGELGDALRAQAARLGLSARIDWQGKRTQDEVVAAMRGADLFVLPAKVAPDGDRDGLPNVLMEAASQLLPIVATSVEGIGEFLTDGVHARLVPPGDHAALARAILAAAEAPDETRRMAGAARARLVAEFGSDRGIDAIAARLRAALGAEHPAPAAPGPARAAE